MRTTMVLHNGDIHTMDKRLPRAQAMAIAGNRVLAVGGNSEIQALLAPGVKAVDLAGRTIVPGFIFQKLTEFI